ncbi:hypothetical protein Pd630_LPD14014 (plasmid) [Rhodococcus opacus PD630]|nr:hypothetical protein Pd630_LPD14014 [Rhodococcus opacus PD630]
MSRVAGCEAVRMRRKHGCIVNFHANLIGSQRLPVDKDRTCCAALTVGPILARCASTAPHTLCPGAIT